jgi:hypothetical protein
MEKKKIQVTGEKEKAYEDLGILRKSKSKGPLFQAAYQST